MPILINSIRWVVILLLQVLLFNHLQCYGLCQPQVYILCLMMLPPILRREGEMLIGLALGGLMDVLSNSMGVHMAACVLVMFIRQPLLASLVQNMERLSIEVSMRTIHEMTYVKYTVLLVFTHQLVISALSAFSWVHLWWTILQILFSALLAIILILGYNIIRR